MEKPESRFNLNDIAIFVEIAKQRNISRAAELTGVPTATLSRRLRVLEARLGVQLLSRTTRRIALTQAGKRYYDYCHQLVEQAVNAQDVLMADGVRPRGTLKVMLPDQLDAVRLLNFIPRFAQDWPELHFRYEHGYGLGWQGSDFDVALRWGAQADCDLVARPVGHFDFRLYASASYLAQHGNPEHPSELARHQCLKSGLCPELDCWTLQRAGQRVPFTPQARLGTHDLDLARQFAQAGAGIAALPALAADDASLKLVLPTWRMAPVALYALYGSRTPPARARIFVESLIAHARPFRQADKQFQSDRNVGLPSRSGQPSVRKVGTWVAAG